MRDPAKDVMEKAYARWAPVYDTLCGPVFTSGRRAAAAAAREAGGRILEMAGREYYVRGRGYITSLAAIENVTIRASGPAGTPVLVKDVGSVSFGPDIRRGLLEWNGEGEAVGGTVVMRYGENALDVIERVKKKVSELQPSFPDGVELNIAYDRSGLIERSIETLKHSLLEEGLTAAEVAEALATGVSRAAVIGKIRRLGFLKREAGRAARWAPPAPKVRLPRIERRLPPQR